MIMIITDMIDDILYNVKPQFTEVNLPRHHKVPEDP